MIEFCGCLEASTKHPGAAYRRCAPTCEALIPTYDRSVLEFLGLQPIDFEILDVVLRPYVASVSNDFPVGCR